MGGCSIALLPFFEGVRPWQGRAREVVEETFGLPVEWLTSEPVPPAAYDTARGQFRAAALLQAACPRKRGPLQTLLAYTEEDAYEPGLNFVFGLASPALHCALVATVRLDDCFYGLEEDEANTAYRILVETNHELGHTFGLEHCPYPGCVMHFSNTLADTDRKGYRFCPRCRAKLDAALAVCHGAS